MLLENSKGRSTLVSLEFSTVKSIADLPIFNKNRWTQHGQENLPGRGACCLIWAVTFRGVDVFQTFEGLAGRGRHCTCPKQTETAAKNSLSFLPMSIIDLLFASRSS